MTLDRARGALLGAAVGDALGTTYEFARIEQPAYPTLATQPATDVVGDGPFGLAPGAITDDTQLAVCLARSLADKRAFDAADLAKRYVAWSDEAFDIGNQTRSALWHIERSATTAGGMLAWRDSGHRGAGNGSLMRTAPIGVAYSRAGILGAGSLGDVILPSLLDSMLTHADPRCMLACAAYNYAIAWAISAKQSGFAIGALMVEAARTGIESATRRLKELWGPSPDDTTIPVGDVDAAELALIDSAREELLHDLEMAQADDPNVYDEDGLHVHRFAGFVRLAFRLSFWHVAHTETWKAALVDIASRGGDADTNAAIAGGLLGARDGESAIPEAWRLRVLSARQPGSERWADAHHPRHLLLVVK